MKRYFWNLVVLLDIAGNVIFLAGNAHETVSQRAAWSRDQGKRWGCVLCRVLDSLSKDHCSRSIVGVNRAANHQG